MGTNVHSKNNKTHTNSINGLSDRLEQANALNHHFSRVGANALAGLNNIVISNFLPHFTPPVFDLLLTDTTKLAKAIDNLSLSPSCGFDGITAFMIKSGKHELLNILEFIFNFNTSFKYQYKDVSRTMEECQSHSIV